MRQEPPPGKVWICANCGMEEGKFHGPQCQPEGIRDLRRVEQGDFLVATWIAPYKAEPDRPSIWL